ncbi:MAG: glycosyltransferase family 4 protein [Firmicutes bacterium]|nr:glycosyltransferase family 4 protein [Bacillota bacterium]
MCEYHDCHIISFGDPTAGERAKQLRREMPSLGIIDVFPAARGLKAHLRRAGAAVRLLPPPVGPYLDGQFVSALRNLTRQQRFNVVFYDVIVMAPYRRIAPDIPSIHSPNDATSRSYERLALEEANFLRRAYLRLCMLLLRRYERCNYRHFSAVHVVSPVDGQYLQNLDQSMKVRVIPIAVDDRFLRYEVPALSRNYGRPPRLLFSGNLAIRGILTGLLGFIDRGLPRVLVEFPDAEFIILSGGSMPDSLATKASHIPAIKVIQWAADYLEAVAQADVVVAPDRSGTGLKNRVLQAMALGRPVVGSSIALEGFDVVNGVHAVKCDSPEEMGEAVARLFRDEKFCRSIGNAARGLVRDLYAAEVIAAEWRALFEEIGDRPSGVGVG